MIVNALIAICAAGLIVTCLVVANRLLRGDEHYD